MHIFISFKKKILLMQRIYIISNLTETYLREIIANSTIFGVI